MEIKVRYAKHNDAKEILLLSRQLNYHHLANLGFDVSNQNDTETDDTKTDENFIISVMDQKKCQMLVAEDHGAVIGYIEYYINEPDNDFMFDRYIYVQHCFIEESYNSSVALLLLYKHVTNHAQMLNIHYIHADVYYANRSFYNNIENLGFIKLRTRFFLEV